MRGKKKGMKKLISVLLSLSILLSLVTSNTIANANSYNKNFVIDSGANHRAIIKPDGSLWMWGYNKYGTLGDGTTSDSYIPIKIMDNVKDIQCADYYNAAIKKDGSLWVWGQFGGYLTEQGRTPKKIMENVEKIYVTSTFAAAIKTDGSLWTWGYNGDGQLGDGTFENRTTPQKIMDNVKDVNLVSSYYKYGAAIKDDGTLWMWGNNKFGQLGNTSGSTKEPRQVMTNIKSIACSGYYCTAIKSDDSLWAWGLQSYGTPMSYSDNVSSPVKIIDDVLMVCVTKVIKKDGTLWAWGNNQYGEIGNGTTTSYEFPVKIADNVKSCVSNTAFIKNDGSLWTWGYNGLGLIGDGTTKDKYEPVKIMDNVIYAKLFGAGGAAIKGDGSLWMWGDNTFGVLGDGTTKNHLSPIKIMNLYKGIIIEGENLIRDGNEAVLKATRYDENGNAAPEGGITWSCSDESVAQITPWGNNVTVKGLKGGKATITATHAESGMSATHEIEVQQKEIRFSKIKPLEINGETIITASIYDGDNLADEQGDITFKIEDTSIAKIIDTTESTMSKPASATIKGLKSGVTKIIATDNENDLTAEATILVGLTPNIYIEARCQKGDYGITKLNFTVENKKYDNLNYDELSQEDVDSMTLKNPTVTTHLSKGLYATSGFGHTSSYETEPSIDSSESLKPGDKRSYSYDVSFKDSAVDNDKSFAVISVSGNNIVPVNKAVDLDVDLPVKVFVNGTKVEFDAMPILESGRTLVPVRKIFNALGTADDDIHWDGAAQKVTAIVGGKEIELQINSTTSYVNGEAKSLDVPARILSGNRTYVPVRFIAESFGAKVMWKGSSYTVNISTGDKLQSNNESIANIKTVSDSSESGFTTEEKTKWLGLGETYNVYNGGNIGKGVYQVENLVVKEEMNLPEGTTISVNGYLNVENKITFGKNSSIVVSGGDINVKKKGVIDMSKGGTLTCDGSFIFNSGTSHKNYLTDGIIKVGGDVELKRNFVAGGKNEFHITNSNNIHIIDVKDDGKQTFSIMRVIDRGFEALDIKQEFDCVKSLIFEDWSVLQPYLFSNLFMLSPMDGSKKSNDDIIARVETGLSRAILEESKDVANLGDISNVTNNMKVKAVDGDFEYLYYDKNSNSFKSYTLDINYTGMDTWNIGGGFGSVTYTEGGKNYKYMIGVSPSQIQDMFTSFKATVTANLAQGVLEAYVSSPSELKVNNAKNIIKSMIMDHFPKEIQTALKDGKEIKKYVKKIKEINDLLKKIK